MSDNTASNLGTGQGVFAQKVGDDLQFKSLLAGTNITLTADANNITITASNDTTALNLGVGSGLFTSKSGDDLQFRSIIANADSGISVTQNSNDLTFQLVSANVDAGKLGGVAASDFLRKSDNLASLESAATARTNLDVYSKAEIDASVVKNNANILPSTDSTWSLGSNSYKWANIYADRFYGRASVAGAIDSIANIGDVDVAGAVNGSVLKYNSSNSQWEVGEDTGGSGSGSATFTGLTDTPANLTGDAGKFVRVNSGETALEFTTDVATQTYVDTQISNLVASAPAALDTLNELAAAMGDDANFATTITNSLATKLNTADLNSGIDAHLNQSNPTSGYVLSWNGSDYAWVAQSAGTYGDADVDTHLNTSSATSSQVLSWNGSDYAWVAQTGGVTSVNSQTGAVTLTTDNLAEGSTNLYYTDAKADARIVAAGSANWNTAYSWGDHSTQGYLTSETSHADVVVDGDFSSAGIMATDGSGSYSVVADNSSNWNTAYGWGDHATQGYLTDLTGSGLTSLSDVDAVAGAGDDGKVLYYDHATTSFKWKTDATGGTSYTDSDVDTHLNTGSATSGQILSWNGSDYAWVADQTGSGGISNVVEDTSPQLGGTLDANGNDIDMGTNTITDAKVGNWDTAYSWGDHSTAGYLTSYTETDPVFSAHTTSNITNGSGFLKNNGSGTWTYDSNTYLTAETNDLTSAVTWANVPDVNITSSSVVQHQANLTITESQISDLSHYTDSDVNTHLNTSSATSGEVLSWNGSDYAWVANTGTGLSNIVEDTSPQLGGTLDANGNDIDMGTNTITDAKVGNWDTAYSWGDHSTQGYLTTETNDLSSAVTWANVPDVNITSSSVVQHQANLTITESQISDLQSYLTSETSHADVVVDGDFTSQGIMLRGASAGSYSILTDNSANWNTAYGWGDHSIAGYQTTASLNGAIDSHLNQSNPTSGYVLSWNGSDYAWVAQSGGSSYSDSDVDTHLNTSSATTGEVLSWNGSDYAWVSNAGSGIALTDLSVTSASAFGNGSLTYNNTTGVFTYTPPLLTGYLQDITGENLADLADVNSTTPSDGQVLTWDNANSYWKPATPSGGSGSAGTEYEEFKLNYATDGTLSSTSDLSSGISGVSIDSASGGDVTITFTGYTTPPLSVIFYGYNYAANEYNVNTLGSTGTTLRKVPGGGSSGSPTAFGSFSTISFKIREAETGASRSFGTTTHAWIRFVMGA